MSLAQRVDVLAEVQRRTEERLDALIEQVSELVSAQRRTEERVAGLNDRMAEFDGDRIERRFREHGHAYFFKIARHDVDRARKRAELLARIADTEVVPVVAGTFASPEVVAAAQEAGAWCVTNGRAIAPGEGMLAS